MATPTATHNPANAVVEEAVRIAAQGQRRASENAQATLQATRKYFDEFSGVSKDLFDLYSATADAGLQVVFDFQNAIFGSSQASLDTYVKLSKDAYARYAELAKKYQATTLKSYQATAKLFENLAAE
jgi:hypothetical protein